MTSTSNTLFLTQFASKRLPYIQFKTRGYHSLKPNLEKKLVEDMFLRWMHDVLLTILKWEKMNIYTTNDEELADIYYNWLEYCLDTIDDIYPCVMSIWYTTITQYCLSFRQRHYPAYKISGKIRWTPILDALDQLNVERNKQIKARF